LRRAAPALKCFASARVRTCIGIYAETGDAAAMSIGKSNLKKPGYGTEKAGKPSDAAAKPSAKGGKGGKKGKK
jgi:hypothetical protein